MTTNERLLVLIGSGETAAQMQRGHRMIASRLAGEGGRPSDVRATIVDTPYGFQSNADLLTESLLDFFGRRVGMNTTVATLRRHDVDLLTRETAYANIRESDFVFTGPGSPSYALRQWEGTQIPELFAEKLRTGGAVVLASAAALTIGRVTVPVYEIYKAGDDPFWMQGLNVLGTIGINAAVIPHYDNREGRDHDTRFCFLGEERLLTLEEQLPPGTFILGIDEHSALMLDLVADIAFVHGRGGVTIRRGGISQTIPATETIPLVALRSAGGDAAPPPARPSADISQNNGTAVAQRLITRERELEAARERERLVEPLIDALLEVRQQARASGDFETADAIRQRLLELGVEVSDSPEGTEYRVGDEAPT